MSQPRLLIATLKLELRKQRINYRQVADVLGLSETKCQKTVFR